ncbi:MAG: PilZ domain-containing protein, partial [Acidobacteriota bacterium]|nr:PilZ domain-containing protein [Acidobacteriota bacterium]
AAGEALREREKVEAQLANASRELEALAAAHAALEKQRARADALEAERDILVSQLESIRTEMEAVRQAARPEKDAPHDEVPHTGAQPHEPAHVAPTLTHATGTVAAPAQAIEEPRARVVDPPAITLSSLPADLPVVFPGPERRASRQAFADDVIVQIDGSDAVLVDLSVDGAQVISPKPLKPNQSVRLRLANDAGVVSCKGKIVWAQLEPSSSKRPFHYRAGMKFVSADEAAVTAFMTQAASGQGGPAAG